MTVKKVRTTYNLKPNYHQKKEKQHEELMIPSTHTITQPYTVMIHPFHTLIALAAMSHSRPLNVLALLAPFCLLYVESVFEGSFDIIEKYS
jgi:hypothetical protein